VSFCLPVDEVIATNRKLTKQHHAVLDRAKLEGALGRPVHTFGGQYLIPTLLGRAGALLDGLVSAHAFSDGNKRTAWLSTNVFLNAFGARLTQVDPMESADFVEAVALHKYEADAVILWFAERLA